jgi:Family of unknown function (DUF6527)
MTRIYDIRPEFVDRIPKTMNDGVIYISRKFATAAHNCCCGCGTKIVTPLKPGRWRFEETRDGVSISPSIGNWSAACQSHYWITDNRIDWARAFMPAQIAANRTSDQRARQNAHAERSRSERGPWGRLWDRIVAVWQALKGWF